MFNSLWEINDDCAWLMNFIPQPITFAEYMHLVLYHPQYGYYGSGKVAIGSQGDYFTSSSLGSDFGELLAVQLGEIWDILEQPSPFYWVEMGAGNGALSRDILGALKQLCPLILPHLEYIIIETSPALIKQQQEKLKDLEDVHIAWRSWSEIPDESLIGCFFSNELVDAFPVHRVILQDRELREIYVRVSEGRLQEVIGELSTPKLGEYFLLNEIDILSPDYDQGYQTEVNLLALDWLGQINQKLKRGYLLTIDYGYTAAKYYHPQRRNGTLNCYYQHRHHDNPYLNIGQQDITTHVNFTGLQKQGQLLGLEVEGFTQQGLFLMALGLGEKLEELSQGKYGVLEVMQRRDALHQLINPMGLGGFGVLIQSKGLGSNTKQPLRGIRK